MYAVSKEQPLGIYCELLELVAVAVALVVLKYVLHHMPYGQVPLAVLVPMDIASPLGGFGQMVCILFLLQGKLFPSGNGVAHHLKVGKLVKQILEITLFLSTAGGYGQQSGDHHNFYN